MDVYGTVVRLSGDPAAGVVVLVSGKSPVTTGSNGSFHVPDVDPAYELILVFSTWNYEKYVRVYEGLTRRHLQIYIPPLEFQSDVTATLSGWVPEAPEKVTRVFFLPAFAATATAIPFTGEYSLEVYWPEISGDLKGKLYVLRSIVGSNGRVAQFDGFAARDLTLTPGAHLNGVNFSEDDLSDPPDLHVSGTTTPASGYTLDGRHLDIVLGSGYHELVREVFSILDDFDYVVPDLPGVTFQLLAFATASPTGTGRPSSFYIESGIPAGAAGMGNRLRAAPALFSPADGASDLDISTRFEWEAGEGAGIDVLYARPENLDDTPGTRQVPGPAIEIYLQGSSAQLPDLAGFATLTPGTAYRWEIERRSYPTSVDGLVSASPSSVPILEFWSESSATFTFTTAAAAEGGGLDRLRPVPPRGDRPRATATTSPSAAARAR